MATMWLVYVEMYEDTKANTLSNVYPELVFPGTEKGRASAVAFAVAKVQQQIGRIGGSLATHGEKARGNSECRVWVKDPTAHPNLIGLYSVYVIKSVDRV